MSDRRKTQKPTRREVLEAALTVSAYAAPLILSASVPATLSAQVSATPAGLAILTGIVTNASNGAPIAGAFIFFAFGEDVVAAVTDASGAYSVVGPPTGLQTVVVTATGYFSRTASIVIAASGTTVYSPTLDIEDN